MKTSLTLDKDLLAKGTFEVPCYPCQVMGYDAIAVWLVQFMRPNPSGEQDFFLCQACLDRWIAYGFGITHETDASWTRI